MLKKLFTTKETNRDKMKKLIEKTVSESEALANRSFLEAYLKHKDVEFVKLLKLDKMSAKEIYQEYKYKTWKSLSFLEREFLAQKFDIHVCNHNFGIMGHISERFARLDECLGVTFENYLILHTETTDTKTTSVLETLTRTDLIVLLNGIQEELDKRTETPIENKENVENEQ